MRDIIFDINQNLEKLETLLSSDVKDTRIIDLHIDICKKDIKTLESIIEFEEACDNYEAANLFKPILTKIKETIDYRNKIK